jgi:phage terminase small subunit
MARKLTLKQEAFFQAYIETGCGAKAYRRAYAAKNMSPQSVWNEANKLLNHPEVARRVQNHREKNQQRHDVTIDSLTSMAKEAYEHAQKDEKGASAMVSALMAIGKLHGLIVDKKQVTSKNEKADLTDAELAAIATASGLGTPKPEEREERPDIVH